MHGNVKHGHAAGGPSNSSTYNIWHMMIERCTNPNRSNHHVYGGAGIRVCDRWLHSFENFLADMGERPSLKHSLGRILDMTNYEPGSVFWMTRAEQGLAARNKKALLNWAARLQ